MEFVVRSKSNNIECRLLDNSQALLFHLRVPENTVEYWKIALNKWIQEKPKQFQQFANMAQQISLCQFPEETEENKEFTRVSFLKILSALAYVLRSSPGNGDTSFLTAILNALVTNPDFNFQIQPASTMFMFCINFLPPAFFPIRLPVEEWSEDHSLEWWRYWHFAFYKWPVELPLKILPNLDLLDEIVYYQAQESNSPVNASFWLQSYAAILKALIKFLEETQDVQFVPFRRKFIPILCALLIKNEEVNIEEQKTYLEHIFVSNQVGVDAKNDLLVDIAHNLKDDAERNYQHAPRLAAVSSAMTQYFLGRYDIVHTIELWNLTGNKRDFLLHGILAFYKKPQVYALTAVILTLLTLLPGLWPGRNLLLQTGLLLSAGLTICALLLCVSGGALALYRLFRKQGLDYIELFFPRLMGAIIVGLSILIFESTVWDITLNLGWGNWLLLCLATYAGSFLYFFVDVHKATRLLPLSTEQIKGKRNRLAPTNAPAARSLQTAWHIFWIGLFEAFTASLIISGLLGYAVIFQSLDTMESYQAFNWLDFYALGILLDTSGLSAYIGRFGESVVFVYLPKLVLLWTGLSLLIGAFAQLLWQDRQVTAT